MKAFLPFFLLVAWAQAESVYTRSMSRVESTDPAKAASMYASHAIRLVYETPLEYDYRARPYRLIPSLATALPTVSSNQLVYTLTLRADARFTPDPCFGTNADGTARSRAVTAADLVYSLKRLADRKNASPGAWIVERPIVGMAAFAERSGKSSPTDFATEIPGLRALDAHTVRFELTQPLYVFPFYLAMAYAAVIPPEAVAYYGQHFSEHPIGSGAYRLASWRHNHEMVFARVPDWPGWKSGPAALDGKTSERPFDRIRYRVIDDVSTQWLCFLAGELDFLGEVSRDNWDAIIDPVGGLSPELKRRHVSLHGIPSPEVAYVGINMDDPILGKNRPLRQALNAAFDSETWVNFYNRRVVAANGPVPPIVEGALTTPAPFRSHLEQAQTLLREAGYPGGIDPATGRRLVLTMDLGRATQDQRETAELMAAFYARIGIKLVPQYYNWATFLKRIGERQSQMYRIGWVGDYSDPENFLMLFYSRNVSPGPNRANYVNPEFDRCFEAALGEADSTRRDQLWARAQEIIRTDCPWIFLHFPMAYSLCHQRVLGYVPSAFPDGTEKYLRCKE